MAKDVDTAIARAMQKKAGLESKIRRLKTMQSTQARKEDAHRKIVIGAAIMAAMRDDPILRGTIARVLGERIRGERDRAMLGLPPQEQGETP